MSFKPPIPLRAETPAAWAEAALKDPEGLLSDHAHCEKKAALTGLSLIHAFPGHPRTNLLLARLAEEELNHFRRVLEALHGFGWKLRPDAGNAYAQGLLAHITKGDKRRALLDRLLVASLIEARSCERLFLLEKASRTHADLGANVGPVPWLDFLFELERCEAGHALGYRSIAEEHFGASAAAEALDRWLDREAEVITGLQWRAAVH